jgi:hypothetical protein
VPIWSIQDGKKKCTKCQRVLKADYEHFRYRDQEKGWLQSECRACETERGIRARWKRRIEMVGHPPSECYLCGKAIGLIDGEVDRVHPGSRGGQYAVGNCAWICTICNRMKGGMPLQELRAWMEHVLGFFWNATVRDTETQVRPRPKVRVKSEIATQS